MSSDKVGVQAQIKNLSPLAIYIHCHSHVLNLSIANACKVPAIRNMIDVVNAVYLFSSILLNVKDSLRGSLLCQHQT